MRVPYSLQTACTLIVRIHPYHHPVGQVRQMYDSSALPSPQPHRGSRSQRNKQGARPGNTFPPPPRPGLRSVLSGRLLVLVQCPPPPSTSAPHTAHPVCWLSSLSPRLGTARIPVWEDAPSLQASVNTTSSVTSSQKPWVEVISSLSKS